MFSPAPQTPLQRKLSYSLDTEETLRLATQKLKQPPPATAGIPHAYVIPVPVVPSESLQSMPHASGESDGALVVAAAAASSSTATNGCQQYQFAPILPPELNCSNGPGGYIHYHHEAPTLTNLQAFNYAQHSGFFLPAGYRLVYAPAGTPQVQPATPATPQLGNSHDGTPPGETHAEQPPSSDQ